MLKGIRFEIPESQRLVRNHVIGEFDDLDIEPAFGGHLLHHIRDLGMWTGGDADANGLASCGASHGKDSCKDPGEDTHKSLQILDNVLTGTSADGF